MFCTFFRLKIAWSDEIVCSRFNYTCLGPSSDLFCSPVKPLNATELVHWLSLDFNAIVFSYIWLSQTTFYWVAYGNHLITPVVLSYCFKRIPIFKHLDNYTVAASASDCKFILNKQLLFDIAAETYVFHPISFIFNGLVQ